MMHLILVRARAQKSLIVLLILKIMHLNKRLKLLDRNKLIILRLQLILKCESYLHVWKKTTLMQETLN